MQSPTRIAVGQCSIQIDDVAANIETSLALMRTAADNAASLLILPELTLTGYMFADHQACFDASISAQGSEIETIAAMCDRLTISVVIGFLERSGDEVFNTVLAIQPDGITHRYRKAHLPPLGADQFVTAGSDLPVVFDCDGLRIGLCVCYDLRFPEWSRALALNGADVIAVPTNWTAGAQVVSDHFVPTRAAENGVFLAIANRSDTESGADFIGQSRIVDPAGETLTSAHAAIEVVYADIDPLLAQGNNSVANGAYSLNLLEDRRPELYSAHR